MKFRSKLCLSAMVLVISGCAGAGIPYRFSQKYIDSFIETKTAAERKRVLVVPTSAHGYIVGTKPLKSIPEDVLNKTAGAIDKLLIKELPVKMKDYDFTMLDESLLSDADRVGLSADQAFFSTLCQNIALSTYAPFENNERYIIEGRKSNFDYSMGKDISYLSKGAAPDYMLFSTAAMVDYTAGYIAWNVSKQLFWIGAFSAITGPVYAGPLGDSFLVVYVSPPMPGAGNVPWHSMLAEDHSLSLGLVDTRTGDIVLFIRRDAPRDLKNITHNDNLVFNFREETEKFVVQTIEKMASVKKYNKNKPITDKVSRGLFDKHAYSPPITVKTSVWKYAKKFTATLPVGWVWENKPKEILALTRDGAAIENILVYSIVNKKDVAIDLVAAEFKKIKSSKDFKDLKIIEESDVKLSGVDAKKITFSFALPDGLEYKIICYGFYVDKTAYFIKYAALARYYFEKYLPAFDDFASSLHILQETKNH